MELQRAKDLPLDESWRASHSDPAPLYLQRLWNEFTREKKVSDKLELPAACLKRKVAKST